MTLNSMCGCYQTRSMVKVNDFCFWPYSTCMCLQLEPSSGLFLCALFPNTVHLFVLNVNILRRHCIGSRKNRFVCAGGMNYTRQRSLIKILPKNFEGKYKSKQTKQTETANTKQFVVIYFPIFTVSPTLCVCVCVRLKLWR